jgi:hypothetical protein
MNMKTEINDQVSKDQPEILRLSLRMKTKLKSGAFVVAPCPTQSCHC